jgi:hypothetical protein
MCVLSWAFVCDLLCSVCACSQADDLQSLRRDALYLAVKGNFAATVAALASDLRVDVNRRYEIEEGRTVFHIACLTGTPEVVAVLAGIAAVDVHATDHQGMTGFQHVKANESSRLDVLRVLAHHPRWLGDWTRVRDKAVVSTDAVSKPASSKGLRDAMGVEFVSHVSKVMQRRLNHRFDDGLDDAASTASRRSVLRQGSSGALPVLKRKTSEQRSSPHPL